MTVGHASPQVKTRVACSGRPAHAGVRRRGDWSLRGGCLLLWIVCGPWCGRPLWGQESDAAVACELRVVWGGPTSRSYEGLIAIDRGSVQPLRNLSLQSDSIGTIRGEDAQTLAIHPHSPSGFGGVDIAVRGSLSSRLRLQMNDPFSPQTKQFDLRLGDLLQGSWMESLDQQGNRLAIERQVHDRLRVRWDSEQAIFDGGQTWQVQIAGYQTGLEAGAYVANLRFVSSTASAAEVQQKTLMVDDSGGFTPFNLDLQVPEGEGAYQLEIAIQRRTILKSLVSSGPLLVRRVDLVVAPQRPPPKIVGWRPLASIDPLRASKPGSLSWLSSLDMRSSLSVVDGLGMGGGLGVVDRLQPYNPLAGSLNQPLSHGRLETRTLTLPTAESGVANELPCLTLDGESWLALPLSGLTANVPHRLRVRVPTDRPMELLVSVQQANVAGEYPQLGLDSGVLVEQRQARADGPLAIHDVVFWPRGEKAYALLVNSVPQTQASVLDLQLEQAQMSPPGEPQDSREEDVQQQTLGSKRMIGLNLDKPLLADGVSASRERDPLTGRALESWSTWQQAATRVCQLMEQREANTLLLKGFADGGGVFPSKRLQPSPRFDSGTFFSDGRASEIKDAVELLLRYFDRSDKYLILSLDLNTALPNLVRFENGEGQPAIEQQRLETGDDAPQATTLVPRYNPLNARLQEEVLAVIRDIVARYGHHASFAGIALQLDAQSQLVFAGDRWGYDTQTINEFQQFTQLKLPPREQWGTVFAGPARLAFLDWRAQELSQFYARLGETVHRGTSGGKLYLNAVRLWDSFPSGQDFFYPEAIIRNPQEYLLAFGISPEHIAQAANVELMRGSPDGISDSVNSQDWIRQESEHRALVEFHADQATSAIVLRYPRRYALAAPEKFHQSGTRWIYPTLFQPHVQARKQLVQQVFHSDPLLLIDGGWLPFSGQDEAVRPLYRTLSELPPLKLTPLETGERGTNLRVRQGSYQDKSYLQFVNNASWDEQVTIRYQTVQANAAVRALGGRTLDWTTTGEKERGTQSFRVAAYDVVALEISDPRVTLTQLQHAPVEATLRNIADQLAELEELVSQAADPTQQKLLANLDGDFERWDDNGAPVGWSVSSLPQVHIGRSIDLPHSGKFSLLIENRSKSSAAWIQSRPVAPPRTGRLAVQAWLRAPAVSEPLLVRLSLIGRTRTGQRFERSALLGGRNDSSAPIAIDWGRKPLTLYVGDIPTEETVELVVSIELIGPGKVWVDDVQIFESLLQPDERNHLRGQLLVANQKLAESNAYPAEKLLDSHWGQYLLRYGPLMKPEGKVAQGAPAAVATPSRPVGPQSSWSESPSVLRQLRESLRDRWRR